MSPIGVNPSRWPQSLVDVAHERGRQEAVEGWSPEHDDQHVRGELAQAALSYAMNAVVRAQMIAKGFDPDAIDSSSSASHLPGTWPWDPAWWKPKDARRNLVKAAALIIAEIDRLDRLAGKDARWSD